MKAQKLSDPYLPKPPANPKMYRYVISDVFKRGMLKNEGYDPDNLIGFTYDQNGITWLRIHDRDFEISVRPGDYQTYELTVYDAI